MNIAEWILVIMLSITLFIFLVVGILLLVKLIHLADEAGKIVATGQGIAAKADDIVDNVKGMTSVGGIVKTFANHVIENQERRYAAEDAERKAEAAAQKAAETAAEEAAVREAILRTEAERAAEAQAAQVAQAASSHSSASHSAAKSATTKSTSSTKPTAKKSLKSKLTAKKSKK